MIKKKIAIIGASIGQLPLCRKAKELDIETFCFAWGEGAICKYEVDHFYPISIIDFDKILKVCQQNQIDGIVSNASDTTARTVSYIAEQLKLNGTPYNVLSISRN